MNIVIGDTYGFRFKDGYTALNGIWTVTHGLSWNSLQLEQVDLYESLYKKVGKTQNELESDKADLSVETFYRLENVADKTVIFIPRSYIIGIPVPDVFLYSKIMLTVDLGLFDDPDKLTTVRNSVGQVLEGLLGVTSEVNVVKYGEQWMEEGDFEQLVENREAARTGIVNYYSEALKKDTQISQLSARIAVLEDIVQQQHAQLNP